MRVSDNMATALLLEQLQRIRQDLFQRTRELATGRRLHQPSQDPAAASRMTRLRDELSRLTQFGRNMDRARVLLNAADSTLNSLRHALDAAAERTAFALNDTIAQPERDIIAREIEEIRDNIVALSTTQVDGRYIFSGSRTDIPPLAQTAGGFVYQGGGDRLQVEIAAGRFVRTTLTGDRIFTDSSADIVNTLTQLADALRASDTDTARALLERLGGAATVVDTARVELSEALKRIETTFSQHDRLRLALAEETASLEDADLAESITALTGAELRLQAALQTGARRMPSLFDLIG